MGVAGRWLGFKRWPGAHRWGIGLVLLGAVLAGGGCATYSTTFKNTERELLAHRPAQALKTLEARRPPKRDRVLYLLNKAMLLRMNGRYRDSNQAFEQAKRLITELSALSLREQSESFIINDATRSYVGDEYEQVLLHLYEALNYIALGDLDDARVEAGQVDLKLRAFHERNPGAHYTEDAFARYLNGMIYEELGETSDALIAYRKAYQAYLGYRQRYQVDVPAPLKADLLRLTRALGLDNEFRRYQAAFKLKDWPSEKALEAKGQLVFILSNGLVPVKRQSSVVLPNPGTGQLIRVSLPHYEQRPTGAAYAGLDVDGRRVDTVVMENVGAIAVENLKDKMPAITARAIARAAVKATAAAEANRQGNPLLGLLVNIAGIATEVADTRSWLTLPDNIQMARLPLPPGDYTVKVTLHGRYGRIVAVKQFSHVRIRRGHITFLTYDWI